MLIKMSNSNNNVDPDIPRLPNRDNTGLLFGITICCVLFFFIGIAIWQSVSQDKFKIIEMINEDENQVEAVSDFIKNE
jgi:hypothetical protein